MGLSNTGSRCLLTTQVSGTRGLPRPYGAALASATTRVPSRLSSLIRQSGLARYQSIVLARPMSSVLPSRANLRHGGVYGIAPVMPRPDR
jgi:hypothetical protein